MLLEPALEMQMLSVVMPRELVLEMLNQLEVMQLEQE
jgi:hypothetical protein